MSEQALLGPSLVRRLPPTSMSGEDWLTSTVYVKHMYDLV